MQASNVHAVVGKDMHQGSDSKAICHKCNRVGHFSAKFFSKGAAMNDVDGLDELSQGMDSANLRHSQQNRKEPGFARYKWEIGHCPLKWILGLR